MTTIAQNAVVTVIVGDAQTVSGFSGGLNAGDVLSAVSAYLNSLGKYQVESSSDSGALLARISPLIQETFQATLKMQVYYPLDTTEIVSDVAEAFQEVTGQTPTNITIPSFVTTSGQEQQTNQAAPASTTTQSIGDAIARAFSNITSAAKSLLIGLAAIIVLVLVLIAYGPNIGRAVSA